MRTRVNKIKVMYDKPRVNVKVELGLTFAFTGVKFSRESKSLGWFNYFYREQGIFLVL